MTALSLQAFPPVPSLLFRPVARFADSTTSPFEVGILGGVLMAMRAVCSPTTCMCSVLNRVMKILRVRPVGEILQSVIRRISVKVARDLALRARPDESFKYQVMHVPARPDPRCGSDSDVRMTVLGKSGLEYSGLDLVETEHSTGVTRRIPAVLPRNRTPLFLSHFSIPPVRGVFA